MKLGIKPIGRIILAANGFLYDFLRYCRFASWHRNMKDQNVRNYYMAKTYHSLEKSMSFKNRNSSSGWRAANDLLSLCKIAEACGNIGYHDNAAASVLRIFLTLPENSSRPEVKEMLANLNLLNISSNDVHGSLTLSKSEMQRGKLNDPELFFLSRYSLREFSTEEVDEALIHKAVRLAMKTPSVCNRQEWAVYHINDRELMDTALRFQNGNRGFGHKLPNLLIITVDLNAFTPGLEHYQHWIDGGMFSMSLIYALHSLGLGSCCLNWSQTPKKDKELRKAVAIKDNHTIMMMLAVGWPENENAVCASTRKPLDEVFISL